MTTSRGPGLLWGRFDKVVLGTRLSAGLFWLATFFLLGTYELVAVGFCYVVPATVYLAFVPAEGGRTPREKRNAYLLVWAASMLTWALTVLTLGLLEGGSDPFGPVLLLVFAVIFATITFGAWQALSVMLSQLVVGGPAVDTSAVASDGDRRREFRAE